MKLNKRLATIGALIFIVITVLAFKIKVPYYIESNGVIKASVEWKLEKTSDGIVISTLRNNLNNTLPFFSTTEFQRGDNVTFELFTSFKSGMSIRRGDTIATIHSHLEYFKILELEKELINQQQQREVLLSGEKPALIDVAYEEMRLAEAEFETQEKMFERTAALHQEKVIADLEYELAYNEYMVKKQRVNITKADYLALIDGSKQEEVDLVNAQISAIKNQIANLEKRLDALTIVTPIDGIWLTDLNNMEENQTVAHVLKTEEMAVVMPIELSQLPYVKEGGGTLLNTGLREYPLEGTISLISDKVEHLNQRQVVFVSATFENEKALLKPNMRAKVKVDAGEVSLWEYLRRLALTVYHN
jgi:multidrug efflux pump subunit AcrA (membrane-fusion protein)